jgi:glycosyltransferase involved in cell wall biosynthesis
MNKLSVITVTYQCADLIGPTLESVARQNDHRIEHLVIDGGSTDGTLNAIAPYREGLACFISEPDRGIFDAMNKGIRKANGDWILFLNAGDVFHETLDLNSLTFDWPADTDFVAFPYIVDGQPDPHSPDLATRYGMPTSHQGMFISTRAARENPLDTRYRVAADYDFYLRRRGLGQGRTVVEQKVLSRVQPGGYSEANLDKMIREYHQIIRTHLGWKKAFVFSLWSRPKIFAAIKSVLPAALFRGLKRKF